MKAYLIRFGKDIERIPNIVIDELRKLEALFKPPLEDDKPGYQPGQKVLVRTDLIDITATIITLIAQTKARVDTPLGIMTIGLHRLAPIPL